MEKVGQPIIYAFRAKGESTDIPPEQKEHVRNDFNLSESTSGTNGLAHNVNSQINLNKKMSALEFAQRNAAKTEQFSDGRIRYYTAERSSKTPGLTRGASYVTEHNPGTGQVRSWMESYDQSGNVNRVHPKMIDGQTVTGQHYPPTKIELDLFSKKQEGPK